MFQLTKKQDKYLIYEIKDPERGVWLRVIPERGGIITSLGFNGREILYLDEKSLNVDKHISGGIPILFPICGRLKNQIYSWDGKEYNMGIHGLARNYPWEVVSIDLNDKAIIKLKFTGNNDTKNYYPFDFELIFTYILDGNKFRIDQEYINKSDDKMPFYAGFHPYFRVGDKKRLKYDFNCTRYLDCDDLNIKPYNGDIDLTGDTIGKILLDVKTNNVSFYDPGLKWGIRINFSQDFKYITLWSLKGEDFICVEPWMAKPDAFNTDEDLKYIEPGQTLNEYLEINFN